jgi:hypothetical protein
VTLYYSLVIAHLITDFLQPTWMVKWSKQSPYGLIVHALSYTLLSAIVLFGYNLWWVWLLVLGITHFVIDEVKYNVSPKLPGWEMPFFLLDQFIHISIIICVTFLSGLAALPISQSSYFIKEIQPYKNYLLYVVSYIVATFSISILIFETDRTIAVRKTGVPRKVIITFDERLLGMTERAIALTLLLVNNLFFLFPLAFTPTIISLFKENDDKQPKFIELTVGIIGILFVALIARILG